VGTAVASRSTAVYVQLYTFIPCTSSIVLIFILVLVTHVHTTNIQCMQTLSMYIMGQMLTHCTTQLYTTVSTAVSRTKVYI
jgi:hypothetical protein